MMTKAIAATSSNPVSAKIRAKGNATTRRAAEANVMKSPMTRSDEDTSSRTPARFPADA